MSGLRVNSSPDLFPKPACDDHTLEGIAANVKLLLKLIQEHNEASTKDTDDRRVQRVGGMISILDDVKVRIQKSQTAGKKRQAELRRCNTDLRISEAPRDKKSAEPMDETQKLQRELNACIMSRKSLEMMCSSLGKEKRIMASELARKVQELNGMEELINDIKAQNDTLLAKVKTCASEHKEKHSARGEMGQQGGNAALQERNLALSAQLLKALGGYQSLKRKINEAQEENSAIRGSMAEMEVEVTSCLDRIHSFQQRMAGSQSESMVDIAEQISALEHTFEGFKLKILRHEKTDKCVQEKGEIDLRNNTSVVA